MTEINLEVVNRTCPSSKLASQRGRAREPLESSYLRSLETYRATNELAIT